MPKESVFARAAQTHNIACNTSNHLLPSSSSNVSTGRAA